MFAVRIFGLEGSLVDAGIRAVWPAMLGGLIAVLQVLPVDLVSPAMPGEDIPNSSVSRERVSAATIWRRHRANLVENGLETMIFANPTRHLRLETH